MIDPLEILDSLDSPDCDCDPCIWWDERSGRWEHCPHLSQHDHSLTDQEWTAFLRRLCPEEFIDRPHPGCPTAARPGSEEKITVMQRRAAQGRAVFHPRDLTIRGLSDADECT